METCYHHKNGADPKSQMSRIGVYMKLLVTLLGWVPVLGISLKLMYIGNLASEMINQKTISVDKVEAKSEAGEEYFQELADGFYEENLREHVDELGLPEFATNKAKDKAIQLFSTKLKEQYQNKVSS